MNPGDEGKALPGGGRWPTREEIRAKRADGFVSLEDPSTLPEPARATPTPGQEGDPITLRVERCDQDAPKAPEPTETEGFILVRFEIRPDEYNPDPEKAKLPRLFLQGIDHAGFDWLADPIFSFPDFLEMAADAVKASLEEKRRANDAAIAFEKARRTTFSDGSVPGLAGAQGPGEAPAKATTLQELKEIIR